MVTKKNKQNPRRRQRGINKKKSSKNKGFFRDDSPLKSVLHALDAFTNRLVNDRADEENRLAAQVSIYPLRQSSLSPIIQEAFEILEKHHLRVIPGTMSSVVIGRSPDLWAGLQEVYSHAAAQGDVVMIVTLSNACPEPTLSEE
jgi:uncharacterized protein YqgV (UPF0045/DUF77 family)